MKKGWRKQRKTEVLNGNSLSNYLYTHEYFRASHSLSYSHEAAEEWKRVVFKHSKKGRTMKAGKWLF